jgi:annexin A7/11
MVSLCNANRDESTHVDPNRARDDANALLQAGKLRVGTDESAFNMILCQRSIAHLKVVFEQYQQLSGKSLEKSIKSEFSGDIETGLLAIVRCVTNRAEFFAKCLHNSMAGMGTNDQQLIRLVATRCEVDMQDIKAAFEKKYGKTLKSFIKVQN